MRHLFPAAALTAAIGFAAPSAATTLILSDSDTDPDAGVNQIIGLGNASSLYIWIDVDPNQTVTTARMNITSSDASVLNATSHTIFNPLVDLGSPLGLQRRWSAAPGSDTAGGVVSLGDLVVESSAVAIPLPDPESSPGLDPGYGLVQQAATLDQGTVVGNRFLHAIVSFTGTALGTTTVATATEDPDWINDENFDPIANVLFTNGTVEVRTPGDANGDGNVDFADFSALSGSFGQSGTGWETGDFNGDGNTDFADFSILSGNFGTTAPQLSSFTAVPEPTSLALLALGGLMTARRRRR